MHLFRKGPEQNISNHRVSEYQLLKYSLDLS